jgi:hypothetical protein
MSEQPEFFHHHHRHKHQALDPLTRSVSSVLTALSNVSSVFQLFSFFVVCSDMISKEFGLVAFFTSEKQVLKFLNYGIQSKQTNLDDNNDDNDNKPTIIGKANYLTKKVN